VYALGIVLFEMLTGRLPFSDPNVYDLMNSVLAADAPDVREFNAEIEPEVAGIVATMLAKDPARRYQNMRELIVDLDRLPRNAASGPLKLDFSLVGESSDTMRNVPLAVTPRAGPRVSTPPPGAPATPQPGTSRRERTTPPPEMGRRAAVTPVHLSAAAAPAAANVPVRNKPRIAEPEPTKSDAGKKARWNVLIMGALMFAAGASWGYRNEITGLLESLDNEVVAYIEAGIVTLFGLVLTVYWFGVHQRRKREREAGIGSLASMKWRDCVGLVLAAMHRDGYEDVPASERPGDSGTDFLLHRDTDLVLLGYKHGTAYRIGETDLREFVADMQMQGAGRGILATLGTAETEAGDLAKRFGIELLDGAALWPKVRQLIPALVRDHVRLQAASQTWKGIAIGGIFSLALGAATFFAASQMAAKGNSELLAKSTAPGATAVAATSNAVSADADRKRINVATAAMAKVAALTDAERVQRRADALKQVKANAQVSSAGWSSESTLLLTLRQSDGADKALSDAVCGILGQYEELHFTRLQMQPPVNATTPIHWRQCQ